MSSLGASGSTSSPAVATPRPADSTAPASSGTPSADPGTPPAVSLPSGGGAIRGMGEKSSVAPVTGTSTFSIPIAATRARNGESPELTLTYSSGSGNGPFGLGWHMDMPTVTRRTDKGLPRYLDYLDESQSESDSFLLSNAEDLVPIQIPKAAAAVVNGYALSLYRPRIEGLFARIERWTSTTDPGDVYWRTISSKNEVSVFGRSDNSRIFASSSSPIASSGQKRIFSWLLCEVYDPIGNAVLYTYKAEDDAGVDLGAVHELNRDTRDRAAQRYLKSVRYGNRTPARHLAAVGVASTSTSTSTGITTKVEEPQSPLSTLPQETWAFEVVLDYGEHDLLDPKPGDTHSLWTVRQDVFSAYRAGFEVRTYRLCRRVLLFHHFPDELKTPDLLISATELSYSTSPNITFLTSAVSVGYMPRDETTPPGPGPYFSRRLPAIELQYSKAPDADVLRNLEVRVVDNESLENVPAGVVGQFRWMDLYGEGMDGIFVSEGEQWYYKRNLSPGNATKGMSLDTGGSTADVDRVTTKFGRMEIVPERPAIRAGASPNFMDLNGDGRLDVVELSGPVPGYYRGTRGGEDDKAETWEEFRPLQSWPNVDFEDPNLKMIDLTGDGLADIFIIDDSVFRFYASLGEDGFAPEARVWPGQDENKGPRVLFSDPLESIHLADLSGDGMPDLCRIRDGDICYWPNMGYGVFGAKVSMDNAPVFDSADAFSQRRVLLCDIDGSGTTDIIYLGGSGVQAYFNESGNGWSPPQAVGAFLPPVDTLSSVTAVDLLGNGTSCLVWSSTLPGDTRISLRYIDLNQGQKPHLLTHYINNLGSTTTISYLPSTAFYLRDKAAGTPWATRLPYPVHCVEKVQVYDEIGRNFHSTRYAYHHGYFDGLDREFRGFGMVEQWDTDDFDVINEASPAEVRNVDRSTHVPPVYTKTWYHTGAFADMDMLQRRYAREYVGGVGLVGEAFEKYYVEDVMKDRVNPDGPLSVADLTAEDVREASRCLKGTVLRQEIYAKDGTAKEDQPYLITDAGHDVAVLQRQGKHSYAVCLALPREEIKYVSERALDDPRVEHHITLEVDVYGNVLKSADICYGRRPGKSTLPDAQRKMQEAASVAYMEHQYTNTVNEADDYRIPMECATRAYEITGIAMGGRAARYAADDFARDGFAPVRSLPEIPFERQSDPAVASKRLTGRSVVRFRKDDLSEPLLPVGMLQPLALQGATYGLCFTPGLLSTFTQSEKVLISDPEPVFGSAGGFVDLENDKHWWVPSERASYHPSPAVSSEEELIAARANFFTPVRMTDPFKHHTTVTYDKHWLLVTGVTDAAENTLSFVYDYRTMKPKLATDANGNRIAFAFDCLAMTVAKAHMGKETDTIAQGDSLEGFRTELSDEEIDRFVSEPLANSASLLGNATCRYVYDLDRFAKSKNEGKGAFPAVTATLHREEHSSDAPKGGRTQISFTYSDGFGHVIQSKALAEPDPATPLKPRWIGSGWTVFNNKGNPVKEFDPFFDDTHEFEFDRRVGVSHTLVYDALQRLVLTVNPDRSWSKVVHGAWKMQTYDAGDTILQDPRQDEHVGQFFRALPDEDYLPTWYDERKDGGKGQVEQQAALKTAKFANTPQSVEFDATGHEFLSTVNNGGQENYTTVKIRDIQGLLKETRDPQGRVVERINYSMLGKPIHNMSMDAGETWSLHDVVMKDIFSWDSRNHRWRTEYDPLRRPTAVYLQSDPAKKDETLTSLTVYGEAAPDAIRQNLRAKIYMTYDQASVHTNTKFDYKGNLLSQQRQLLADYKSELDWTEKSKIVLESDVYKTQTSYDALNRMTTVEAPDKTILKRTYNQARLLSSIRANLKGAVEPGTSLPVWQPFITNIEYNAHAKPIKIVYGNGSQTLNTYDPLTNNLTNRRTLSSRSEPPIALQDQTFTFDAVDNIVSIANAAEQTTFFHNRIVSPNSDYTYDALYRLISATGREHLGQTGGLPRAPSPPGPEETFSGVTSEPGDGNAMGTYVESYIYDSVNNILSTEHRTDEPQYPGWTRKYFYEEKSQLEASRVNNRLSATTVGTKTERYGYDGDGGVHGNMTSMAHLSKMEWDSPGSLKATTGHTGDTGSDALPPKTWYTYDATGRRVRKVTESQQEGSQPTRVSERIYLGGFEVHKEYAEDGVTVLMKSETLQVAGESGPVALVEDWSGKDAQGRLIRYQLTDQLQSVAVEVDEHSELVSYEEYTPYGNTSYKAVLREQPKRYRWAGKERDTENGLYYCAARYYAPWLGRWTAADPIGIGDGVNVFCYVQGNPVSHVDPTGTMRILSQILTNAARNAAKNSGQGVIRRYNTVYQPRSYFSTTNKKRSPFAPTVSTPSFNSAAEFISDFLARVNSKTLLLTRSVDNTVHGPTEQHHLFPLPNQLGRYYEHIGINRDDRTIAIDPDFHKALHGGWGPFKKWNDEFKAFATRELVELDAAYAMRADFPNYYATVVQESRARAEKKIGSMLAERGVQTTFALLPYDWRHLPDRVRLKGWNKVATPDGVIAAWQKARAEKAAQKKANKLIQNKKPDKNKL